MAGSPRVPAISPASVRRISITPGSRILDVSLTPSTNGNGRVEDNGIWKRLCDAGFDDDSVRRRDKAVLIAYIAKLEAEIYDLQHNMGLLILEIKDSTSKFDEVILSAEKAKVKHLSEKAALTSAIAEARKREDNLRMALGVEKECVANIEKAMHELRAECAEVKVSAESKTAEASSMVEDAQRKYGEAEVKLRAAEYLQDEARRSERAAGRKLQEVEAREDDLRRRMSTFKSDCDSKEKEFMLERQSLAERLRVLGESQSEVLQSQALLNQSEADILSKSQALKRLEKELEDKNVNIAAEVRVLMEQKSNLERTALSLLEREKVVVEKEILLTKKEQELLILQEMHASREHNEFQKILAEQEITLKSKRGEFEAELLAKQKVVEEDIERKRRAWELRELELKQRDDLILEKEQDLEVQSRVITDKGEDLAEKMKNVQERECLVNKCQSEIELTKCLLQKEREEIDMTKIGLESSLISMEAEMKLVSEEKLRMELMKSETSELLVLETKLKEEIDIIRAQKQQLDTEAEKLMAEKSKFETEWEFIDVKREELRREEERIAGERELITKFLKDGRDGLNLEKETLREQYKQDLESLIHDRETFMSESQRERSDWFSKFQKERADFLLEIECRKREVEDCVNKRHEDIEGHLREKEREFKEEKKRDLQYIASLKEDLMKEQERIASALKKLETEKLEIKLDREERDKAWAELQKLIKELQIQRVKLKEQREMLHSDREEIYSQIELLKDLEEMKVDSPGMQKSFIESTPQVLMQVPPSDHTRQHYSAEDTQNTEGDSPPSSTVSWLKKCASIIFKHPSQEIKHSESSLDSAHEDANLGSVEKELLRIDEKLRTQQDMQNVAPSIGNTTHLGKTGSDEPKLIHEVPSVDEEAAPLEARKHEHENSVSSPITLAARKRRIDRLFGLETDDELQNVATSNKKRRREDEDYAKFKHSCDHGQHVISSANQSEKSQGKEVDSLAEVERHFETSESFTQVQRSEVDQSVLMENELLACSIKKRTVVEELHLLNPGGASSSAEEPCEEEFRSELAEQDEDPSEAKADDKPEIVKQKGKRRAKFRKKV